MTRRMAEIVLAVVITSIAALPAFGQRGGIPPIPKDKLQQAQQQAQQQQAQQQKTEDVDNVKFVKFSMQGEVGLVDGVTIANKSCRWIIRALQSPDDKRKFVRNQDMIDVVKDLKPGDLLKINATITGNNHMIDYVSKQDPAAVADAKAILFEKVTESVANGQPKVIVSIKIGDKADAIFVPNVKDNLGKRVADPAIMAVIKEFKEGDKIEYTRQTLSNQVVIKTIKLAGAPDKAEFIKVTDKTVNGEKFTAIEVKEGTDKPITLLVANTKDEKGKPAKDDKGNLIPDATMLDAVKALTPGQMVEFKCKAETPAKIMLTEIKTVAGATSQPADKAAGGDAAAGGGSSSVPPADNASK